jgi:exosortase
MALLPVIALLVLCAALAILLLPMLTIVHWAWTDQYGAHSHGYLVLALACYFAWRILKAAPDGFHFKPALSAAIPLGAALAVALAARALYIGPIQTVLVPVIGWFAIAMCLGWLTALRLAWPFLFLYFGMPIGGPLIPVLQDVTTSVSTALIGLTQMPFYVDGSFVHLASGVFEIASGCSGLNYLIAALTIAAAQCTLHLSTAKARAKLMVAAAVAGLLANWVRVASLIAIGHYTEMRHYLIRVEHFWFGWALFLVLFAPVVVYGRHLAGREPEGNEEPKPLRALPSMRWFWIALSGTAAATLLAGAVFIKSLQPLPADLMTSMQTGATTVDAFASGWQPRAIGGQQSMSVMREPANIEMYRLNYENETADAYMGHPETSVTGDRWQLSERSVVDLDLAGRRLSIVEYRGTLQNSEYIIWELPAIGGRLVQSRARRIVATLAARISGRTDSQLWALQAACLGDCGRARRDLRSVLTAGIQ